MQINTKMNLIFSGTLIKPCWTFFRSPSTQLCSEKVFNRESQSFEQVRKASLFY
jgi:hypothetical protein